MTTSDEDFRRAEFQKLDNPDDAAVRAQQLLNKVAQLQGASIHCMMGMFVCKPDSETGKSEIITFALGDDMDVAKMFASMARVVKEGIMSVEEGPTEDEVKH